MHAVIIIVSLCPWRQLAHDTQVYESARLVEFVLDTNDAHSFRALQLRPPPAAGVTCCWYHLRVLKSTSEYNMLTLQLTEVIQSLGRS